MRKPDRNPVVSLAGRSIGIGSSGAVAATQGPRW